MVRKRFPVVPVLAVILKIAAVLFLIFGSILLVWQISQAVKSPMSGLKWSWDIVANIATTWFEKTLFPSAFAWVAAEIILGVRDIEFNTRRALVGGAEPASTMTATAQPAPPTSAPESTAGMPIEPMKPDEPKA